MKSEYTPYQNLDSIIDQTRTNVAQSTVLLQESLELINKFKAKSKK